MTTDMRIRTSGSPARALLDELLPGAPAEVAALAALLDRPVLGTAGSGQWRWEVRRHLGAVHALLLASGGAAGGAWQAARAGSVQRRRDTLLARVRALADELVDEGDPQRMHEQVLRLCFDLVHHTQRVRDLAYDDTELELGGSE